MNHYLFDWGDTLMADLPGKYDPMCEWSEVRVMPNAIKALYGISQFGKCHLATNAKDSDESQIRQALRRVGLNVLIDQIFCFQQIGYLKPSKQYFDAIANRLMVKKSKLIMVGDDLNKDVIGAIQSGLTAIWYNRKCTEVPYGITAVTDLAELINLAQQKFALER